MTDRRSTMNTAPGGLTTPLRRSSTGHGAKSMPKKPPPPIKSISAVALGYPAPSSEVTPHLAPLKDSASVYAQVAKSSLALCQVAIQSSAVMEDTSSIVESSLMHDSSFCEGMSLSFGALMECLTEHTDRRCRLLAAKTLAIMARAAYARIRPSVLLWNQRDGGRLARLEDEIANEVPSALVTAALSDPDDGVAAGALEALAILALTTSSTSSTLVEDELVREIQSILGRPSPSAPSLRAVGDEDPAIPQMELTSRIYENILGPRLVPLLHRLLLLGHDVVAAALPVVVGAVMHQWRTTVSVMESLDRTVLAKRWSEVDAVGMAELLVEGLLLTSPSAASAAALGGLRLASVAGAVAWREPLCRAAVTVLQTSLAVPCDLETKVATLSSIVVASRALPTSERGTIAVWLVSRIASLPSTLVSPSSVWSAGVLMGAPSDAYRRPARVGLWTEVALAFFLDGPEEEFVGSIDVTTKTLRRHEALTMFLSSTVMAKLLSEKARGPVWSVYDEVLLVFTATASEAGRRFRVTADGTLLLADPEAKQVLEWIKLSTVVLSAFVSCLGLGSKTAVMDEDLSVLTAGQVSYVRLLQEYLFWVGMLHPDTSVSLKLTANACPPHLLWDQLAESASFLSRFDSTDMHQGDGTLKLLDEIVARETKQGVASHHLRLHLLTMAADNWVQGRISSIRQQFEAPSAAATSNLSLKVQSARDILLAVSPKRLLTKVLENHAPPPPGPDGKKKRDPVMKLAHETVKVSVACIESIALMACDWRLRFGSSQDSKHIVSVAVGLLQGKVDETPADDNMRALMGPICDSAVHRIQAFYEREGGKADNAFPVSDLVAQPVKPKIKPLISTTKPPNQSKEKVARGHMMQLCRQIITARVEQAVFSCPPADSLLSSARPTNWLRLSVPPLPESRDARLRGNFGEGLAAWGTSAVMSSSSSDAAALVSAYTYRRLVRHDAEDEFRLTVLMRVYNTTPITFEEGLRVELGVCGITPDLKDLDDPKSTEVIDALGGTLIRWYWRVLSSRLCPCTDKRSSREII